ncbi:12-oxophytodienoate reductase [Nocardia vulneris]|uniref:1,2-oxophytodienoate reductase n=1 Tax=Nocardia vulneris TaxID=1141657 RepID=A0ABR4ZB14_9NOCA|nr:12-oxophytodienoate reductase [Nocardia vulneris]KIA62194.1 1,2-oxophytodienoate reductase [Nocardia vulneris]
MSTPAADRATRLLGRSFVLGSLRTRNRIVMAPMTRQKSPHGIPGPDVAAYYARRAAGGAGLIITEGTYIDRAAAPAYADVPHFYGADALAGWAEVVAAVHAAGGVIAPQLWHTGMQRRPGTAPLGVPAEGPSGIDLNGNRAGKAMSQNDIDAVIAAFADGAAAARGLGFDAVEIHGAHGYLIDDFLWEHTNRRTDRYGGDPASRASFAAETVAAVRAAVGPDFPISFRLSQWKEEHYDARLADTPDELERLLTPMANAGVDIFHASTRRYWTPEFAGSDLNLAGWTKKLTGRPAITVGSVGLDSVFRDNDGFNARAEATDIDQLLDRLERDEFDLVAVGRAFLADPQWPRKALSGHLSDATPFDVSVLQTLH